MDEQEDCLESAHHHHLDNFQKQIEVFVEKEFYKVTAQRSLYMALNAFALCLFSVVLFFDARRYSDTTLWAIGVCLLIFGLIEFIEMDFSTSKSGIMQKIFKKK